MPDLVVLEARPTANLGRCFHYTFTGWTDPTYPQITGSMTRMYAKGNRVTVTRAYADTMLANDPTLWREVVDYNVAAYPPPGWPLPGSIPLLAETSADASATHGRARARKPAAPSAGA